MNPMNHEAQKFFNLLIIGVTMEEINNLVNEEIIELYKIFNELMTNEPESLKRIYRHYYEWLQSTVYWDGQVVT